MDEVQTRELRYFIAVAEELNFSRAATKLGVAQPPLSRAIKKLEDKLRVRLLERTSREVVLTDAGEELLVHGKIAVQAVAAACERAQRGTQRGKHLKLAVKPGGDVGLMREIVAEYETDSVQPRIETVLSDWRGPLPLLLRGHADVALVHTPFDTLGLDIEYLITEPRRAVMATNHPMATRDNLGRADLADEPTPIWPGVDEMTAAYWAGRDGDSPARRANHAPRGTVVEDIVQLLDAVSLGKVIAYLPASMEQRYPRGDVVYRPVRGLSPSVFAVAWPEASRSRAVARFVRVAVQVSRTTRPARTWELVNR